MRMPVTGDSLSTGRHGVFVNRSAATFCVKGTVLGITHCALILDPFGRSENQQKGLSAFQGT